MDINTECGNPAPEGADNLPCFCDEHVDVHHYGLNNWLSSGICLGLKDGRPTSRTDREASAGIVPEENDPYSIFPKPQDNILVMFWNGLGVFSLCLFCLIRGLNCDLLCLRCTQKYSSVTKAFGDLITHAKG